MNNTLYSKVFAKWNLINILGFLNKFLCVRVKEEYYNCVIKLRYIFMLDYEVKVYGLNKIVIENRYNKKSY